MCATSSFSAVYRVVNFQLLIVSWAFAEFAQGAPAEGFTAIPKVVQPFIVQKLNCGWGDPVYYAEDGELHEGGRENN